MIIILLLNCYCYCSIVSYPFNQHKIDCMGMRLQLCKSGRETINHVIVKMSIDWRTCSTLSIRKVMITSCNCCCCYLYNYCCEVLNEFVNECYWCVVVIILSTLYCVLCTFIAQCSTHTHTQCYPSVVVEEVLVVQYEAAVFYCDHHLLISDAYFKGQEKSLCYILCDALYSHSSLLHGSWLAVHVVSIVGFHGWCLVDKIPCSQVFYSDNAA